MTGWDLCREAWVPVVAGGRPVDRSLRDALGEAHELDALDFADPLVATALIGFLVAMTMEIEPTRTPQEYADLWRRGRFATDAVDAYLHTHADRFDLLHPRTPFYQVSGLEPVSGGPKPVALLVLEAATGNNVPLFSSSTETGAPSLTPAEATRRLVALHAWDTAAIKTGARGDPAVKAGKTTGNPTGPLGQLGVITLIGRNLFETLLLNRPRTTEPPRATAEDVPAWRRTVDASWTHRPADGICDLYTWQSRRVRLYPADVDGQLQITGVIVAAGDRLEAFDHRIEYRTAWRRVDKPAAGPPLRPRRHRSGRQAWRGLPALLAEAVEGSGTSLAAGVVRQLTDLLNDGILPEDYPVELQLTGVEYGNQSAVIEHVMADRTPVPLRALAGDAGLAVRDRLTAMAGQAEAVAVAVNRLGDNIRGALGGDKIPWDKGQRPGNLFLSRLDATATRVLAGLSRNPDAVEAVAVPWERFLWQEAWSVAGPLLNELPSSAFLGRGAGTTFPLRQQTAEALFRKDLRAALPATAEVPSSWDKEIDDDH